MTLTQESRAVDLQIRWAELALESAQLQYDITASELSSGVLTESEKQDFFMEAEEAAKKSKSIVIRAIQKVIEFIKSIAAKIAAAFSEKKVKADVKAIEEVQNDPEVKNAKVEVPDWKDAEKNVEEYEKAIDDAEKKAKSGKITQEDLDKIKDAKEKCSIKKKVVVGAAATALALGGTICARNKLLDMTVDKLNKSRDEYMKELEDTSDWGVRQNDTEMINHIDKWIQTVRMSKVDAANIRAKLVALRASVFGKCSNAVKAAKNKKGGKSMPDDASSAETASD